MFCFRLGNGAFAQANSPIPRLIGSNNVTSTETVTPLVGTENSVSKNIIVSTRLRQTDKRLRKIQSENNINIIENQSKHSQRSRKKR